MPKKSSSPGSLEPFSEPPSFEVAYLELDDIVAQLERGDLPLERALELHARGQQLAAYCMAQLEQAELKIKTLDLP